MEVKATLSGLTGCSSGGGGGGGSGPSTFHSSPPPAGAAAGAAGIITPAAAAAGVEMAAGTSAIPVFTCKVGQEGYKECDQMQERRSVKTTSLIRSGREGGEVLRR